MGVRAADESNLNALRKVNVINETSVAPQKPGILAPSHRLSDKSNAVRIRRQRHLDKLLDKRTINSLHLTDLISAQFRQNGNRLSDFEAGYRPDLILELGDGSAPFSP
jgi:hypothetical protein